MKPLKTIIRSALVALAMMSGTVAVSGGLVVSSVQQAHAAVVSKIEVHGNVRMDGSTVASYLTIKPGKPFSNDDIDESVKQLFATGLFSDVSIRQNGKTLVVNVVENATVSKVFFEGNNRLKDEALAAGIQTQPLTIYSEDTVLSDVDAIKNAYKKVGRDDTSVSYEVVPLANNRVNIIFRIDESGKVPVGQIVFVGNNAISTYRLRDVISTKKTNFLSFLRTDDIYDPDRVKADGEKLRQFYFNHGYADFQLVSTDAQLDTTKNQYVITFTMEEGARYQFGKIDIQTSIKGVDAANLWGEVKTKSGEWYNAKRIEKSVLGITEKVAEAGFAFVEVTPRGNRNFENNTIDVTYFVDEGPRVYIEAINIVGNDKTREYVIRREFDISEGDAFNQALVENSRQNLLATDLFENVVITNRPGSSPDKVIVTVRITEKATGEFSIGGGYSSSDGPLATVSFSEKNFMGRGQYLRLSGGFGSDERNYGLSFTEPYFLGYRIAAGFDLNRTTMDTNDNRSYSNDIDSAVIRFGIPITEKLSSTVFYTYSDEKVRIGRDRYDTKFYGLGLNSNPYAGCTPVLGTRDDGCQGNNGNEISAAFLDSRGKFKHSGFGLTLSYVDVDNANDPRDGLYASGTVTWYGAGGDARYTKAEGTLIGYTLLNEEYDLVGMGRVRGGANTSLGSDKHYRTVDNFFSSERMVRGYDTRGFGARDPFTGDSLGGQHYFNATAELQFPMPFLPESAGFRGAFFADAGMLGQPGSEAIRAVRAANPGMSAKHNKELTDDGWRYSVGASVIWASPFGPLRVDYAFPLNDKDFDDLKRLSFGLSTKF